MSYLRLLIFLGLLIFVMEQQMLFLLSMQMRQLVFQERLLELKMDSPESIFLLYATEDRVGFLLRILKGHLKVMVFQLLHYL